MQLMKKVQEKIKTMTIKKEHEYLIEGKDSKSLLEEYWKPKEGGEVFSKKEPLLHKGTNENYYDLSVIIPVYNTEKYLRQCVNSVLKQECIYRIQIIIVNDGSTDSSSNIIAYYADYHIPGKDIVIIQQENGGLSSTRNAGIARAQGKYLMFLDSDDSLTKFCVQKALSKAIEENADCVQVQYIEKIGNIMHAGPHIPEGTYTEYANMCKIPGFAAMKIFRADLFDEERFPVNYWFEDTLIHLKIFPKCRKVIVIPEKGYVYLRNKDGITQTRDGESRSVETILVAKKVLLKADYPDGYMDELLRHFSKVSYNRLKYLPEEIVRLAFLEACRIVQGVDQKPSERYQELYEAFLKRDYGIWKWYSGTGKEEEKCRKEK